MWALGQEWKNATTVCSPQPRGQRSIQFALGWERPWLLEFPSFSQGTVECHHLLHSQTLAREQINIATICTHPPDPRSTAMAIIQQCAMIACKLGRKCSSGIYPVPLPLWNISSVPSPPADA